MRTPADVVVDASHHGGHDVAFGHPPRPAIGLEVVDRLAFGDDVAARLPEAAALVDAAHAAIDGLVRGLLQLHIEAGA